MNRLKIWLVDQKDILDNAGSLVGSTVATSGLGFVFWFVAARLFTSSDIGIASAAIAAMLMLSTLGVFGLDALLVGEIGKRLGTSDRSQVGGLISAAVSASFIASALLAVVFAQGVILLTPSSNLAAYFEGGWPAHTIFAIGAGLSGAGLVLDRATIGLLHGNLQLVRNMIFAASKLVLLPLVAWWSWLQIREAEAIYALWALTTLASILVVLPWLIRILPGGDNAPDWRVLRNLSGAAWWHHLVNLGQHGPGLILPVVVAALVSAHDNAAFYVTWMLVSFGLAVPWHLSMVLHAVGSRDPRALASKLRVTLRLSAIAAVAMAGVMAVLADPILQLFGPDYAATAAPTLRILSLSVMPIALKAHYFALSRILEFTPKATVFGAIAGLAELVAVYLGASTGSLTTMAWTLLTAMVLEGLALVPTMAHFLKPPMRFLAEGD